MSNQVNIASVQSYTDQFRHLLQQKGSKTMGLYEKRSFTGKGAKAVEQIGKVGALKKTARHEDHKFIDTPHAARWIYPETYYSADLLDTDDKMKMFIDAPAAYAEAQAQGMGRQYDIDFFAAAVGTAYTGENGTTSTSFDTANQQIAAGSKRLTFDKLREARQILMANDWDASNDPLYLFVASNQMDDLLGMTQATSKDFVSGAALENGVVTHFMGYKIVPISDAILPTDSSANRRVLAIPRSAMICGEWEGMFTKVDERNDKHYATQVYTEAQFGHTRVEEGRIVDILCSEA